MVKKIKIILCFFIVTVSCARADSSARPWTLEAVAGIASGSSSQGMIGIGFYRRLKTKFELGIEVSVVGEEQTPQPEIVLNYFVHDAKFSVYVGGLVGKNYNETRTVYFGPEVGIDYHATETIALAVKGQYLFGNKMLNELIGVKLHF